MSPAGAAGSGRGIMERRRVTGGPPSVGRRGADFDSWAEQGCAGWSWLEVLPSFIRLEDDLDFGDHPYHGKGGPIPIERSPRERWGPVGRAFCEAALDLGHLLGPGIEVPRHPSDGAESVAGRAAAGASAPEVELGLLGVVHLARGPT
jgi:choline dehydrogenase-like flavoprotein